MQSMQCAMRYRRKADRVRQGALVSGARRSQEAALQKAIVKALAWKGWVVIHIPNQATRGIYMYAGVLPGAPDLLAVKAGRVLFMEVKTEKGYLSEKQRNAHERLRAEGFEVRVVRGLEDIEDLLS